jgi:predicted nucleotidyltransferase
VQRPAASRTLDALRARRQEVFRVAAECGARNIRVFGSVARGEDDEKSDIDFLVDMAREPGGFAYFGRLEDLRRGLTALLGRGVDIVDSGALKWARPPTRKRVLSEAVPL